MRNSILRAGALAAVGLAICQQSPAAAIRIDCQQLGPGGKKKLSPEVKLDPEPGILPISIVAIVSADARVVDSVGNGLAITRSTLTPAQAYGFGVPGGFATPPPNNPGGPWVGLNWPFRDFNDGYAPSTPPAPLGNSVGVFDTTAAAAGIYRIGGLIGRQATPAPGGVGGVNRGLPGDGASDFIRFFSFDVEPTILVEREVSVFFENIVVLGRFQTQLGDFVTREVQVPETSVRFLVPAPSAGILGALGLACAARRRRR